jgi:hypothetical protein
VGVTALQITFLNITKHKLKLKENVAVLQKKEEKNTRVSVLKIYEYSIF